MITSLPAAAGEARCLPPIRVQRCSLVRGKPRTVQAAAAAGGSGSGTELAEAWRRVRPPHSGYHWDGTPRRFFEVCAGAERSFSVVAGSAWDLLAHPSCLLPHLACALALNAMLSMPCCLPDQQPLLTTADRRAGTSRSRCQAMGKALR